jgi:hypothetical protein
VAVAAVGAVCWAGGVREGAACGLDWRESKNHFDGVDSRGHVDYYETVGELDLGDGLKLPLIVNFNSSRETTSPSLGRGWMLALVESRFVQTGENSFLMVQPDGLNNPFVRRGGSVTLLDGSAGWKGEIRGDRIAAWASCGWKLEFVKGKIASMTTPKNRKFEWAYSGGVAESIREKGATILAAERGGDGEIAAWVGAGGKRWEIARGDRPLVQSVAGQNVVAGIERCVGAVTGSGRVGAAGYEFAVDEKRRPTLTVKVPGKPDREIAWDPATRLIVRDGEWTYDIEGGGNPVAYAAIGRVNAGKQREFWHWDAGRGEVVVEKGDGIRKTMTSHTSGTLGGRERRMEYKEVRANPAGQGGVVKQSRRDYDEQGRLLQLTMITRGESPVRVKWSYSAMETSVEHCSQNDVTLLIYDKDGRIRELRSNQNTPIVLAEVIKRIDMALKL